MSRSIKSDDYNSPILEELLDSFNMVTSLVQDGVGLSDIYSDYPDFVSSLMNQILLFEGTIELQELYGKLKELSKSLENGINVSSDYWKKCIYQLCKCFPDNADFIIVMNDSNYGNTANKSMKARTPTGNEIKKAFEKLVESGALNMPIKPFILTLKFGMYQELIDAMIKVGYLQKLPDGAVTISLLGGVAPQLAGFFEQMRDSGDIKKGSYLDKILGKVY